MHCWFGRIKPANPVHSINEGNAHYKEGIMVLNEFGVIAHLEWSKLPERFKNVELGIFQIMPNHMHGILNLKELTSSVQNESEK